MLNKYFQQSGNADFWVAFPDGGERKALQPDRVDEVPVPGHRPGSAALAATVEIKFTKIGLFSGRP
jgi:hypothetical protein